MSHHEYDYIYINALLLSIQYSCSSPSMGCYCKIMVSSPFKLEITYYHSSKNNKWWCPFEPQKTPKMHCKNPISIIT